MGAHSTDCGRGGWGELWVWRREAPSCPLGRGNPDAKDGKFADSTMPV